MTNMVSSYGSDHGPEHGASNPSDRPRPQSASEDCKVDPDDPNALGVLPAIALLIAVAGVMVGVADRLAQGPPRVGPDVGQRKRRAGALRGVEFREPFSARW
jgi:hypothetical protein